jgi:hypothetical protein
MTCEEVNQFVELAECVWHLTPDNWLPRLPQVPELRPELESNDPPLPPVQFVSRLNLPGDWVAERERQTVNEDDAEYLPTSWPLLGLLPDGTPLLCDGSDDPLPPPRERVFLVRASTRWWEVMEALRLLAGAGTIGSGLMLAPGGFSWGDKHHTLVGRPLDMLRVLLESPNYTATADQLRQKMGVNDECTTYPEQVIKNTASELRKQLRKAARAAGLICPENPLPSTGRGKDLTYRLNLS